ncbi:MAG: lipid A biosynthesis acyltransferase, partial [Sinomicrobium sp.]|nr:lipid A biosynthesis acyltransferase [Sinomicrobium sp.]
ADFKLLAEHPGVFPDYELTDKFTALLEQQIRDKPEYYFWTHRRWKYRDMMPAYYKKRDIES